MHPSGNIQCLSDRIASAPAGTQELVTAIAFAASRGRGLDHVVLAPHCVEFVH
ncbi:MAG TPA: hypothetical protein VK660_03225 [Xanthomonadaceae bacterium]|nr:hypothetical protein [Xanthomonadaceae bacterium]